MCEIKELWYHINGNKNIEHTSPFNHRWGHYITYKVKTLSNFKVAVFTDNNEYVHKLKYDPSKRVYYFRCDELNGNSIIYIPEKYNKEIERNV